jgi:holo-[acyl-carrier protein] synthase
MAVLRTGVDLVEVDRLRDVAERHAGHFLQRVFTAQELDEARGSYPTLAGRFAAKEAVSKALGTGIGAIAWREIEILRGPEREPVLHLHGEAERQAQACGLHTWSISLSHTREHAVAIVVAMGDEN